jgi:hypothetical protein
VEARSLKSMCWPGWFPLRAPREKLPCPSLSGGWLPMFGTLWFVETNYSNLSFCLHTIFFFVCLTFLYLSLWRILAIGLRLTLNPGQPYLEIFNFSYTAKILFPNKVQGVRTWMHLFGGSVFNQPLSLFIFFAVAIYDLAPVRRKDNSWTKIVALVS